MAYSHQLQKNTGILDPLIFGDNISDSYFFYRGYTTTKNHFITRRDVAPSEAAPQFGSMSTFKLPIIADKLGPIQLMFSLPILNPVGQVTPAVNPRYQDFIGFTAWEKITLAYSTGELYTLFPEDAWLKYKRMLRQEQKDAVGELVAGDKSIPQRVALAQTVQQIIVDLPLPCSRAMHRWLEMMQLAHEPRLEVCWKPLANLFQCDNAGGQVDLTQQLTVVKVRCTLVHLDGDERDFYTSNTETENGIIRLIDDFKMEKVIVPTGTPIGEYRIKLNNFRSSSKNFAFFIRRYNAMAIDPYLGNKPFEAFQGAQLPGIATTIQFWYMEGADGRIFDPVEDRYNRYYLWLLHHISPASTYVWEWNWAITPDDLGNATGSYNLGNTTNTTLVIYFNQVLVEPLEVTMCVNEYNTIQHVRGDLIKNFK
jgi:hypothetical protein